MQDVPHFVRGDARIQRIPSVHGKLCKGEGRALLVHLCQDALPFDDGGSGGEVVAAGGKVRLFEREELFKERVMRCKLPPHLTLAHSEVKVAHMQQDELLCLLGELFGRLPAGEHLSREARSLFGVGVEAAVAVKAVGLSHIVQKSCKADVGRGIAHAAEGMLQNVVSMEVLPLVEAVAQGKLGGDLMEDARLAEQGKAAVGPVLSARFLVGEKDAAKLLEDALGHDVADERMIGLCSLETLFIGREARLGGDTGKAHEP